MGSAIAERLLAHGHRLTVWDRLMAHNADRQHPGVFGA
jgi:3-hydroxyisobutyrate dehydrogenase-like beta-hydroxyacid dehydrogenase